MRYRVLFDAPLLGEIQSVILENVSKQDTVFTENLESMCIYSILGSLIDIILDWEFYLFYLNKPDNLSHYFKKQYGKNFMWQLWF